MALWADFYSVFYTSEMLLYKVALFFTRSVLVTIVMWFHLSLVKHFLMLVNGMKSIINTMKSWKILIRKLDFEGLLKRTVEDYDSTLICVCDFDKVRWGQNKNILLIFLFGGVRVRNIRYGNIIIHLTTNSKINANVIWQEATLIYCWNNSTQSFWCLLFLSLIS